MQLELNSAERLRANWKFLSPEQIEGLLALGESVLDIIEEAAINASVLGRTYGGKVDMRPHYRAFQEAVAQKSGWRSFQIQPTTAYAVAGLVLQLEPQIYAALCEDFGTDEPPILPPIIAEPEPPVEPTPEPTEEPPVTDPSNENPTDQQPG